MKTDKIIKIEIDGAGRLNISPASIQFTMIYRTASGVHWNNKKKTLYSPKPKEWAYFDWFNHIIKIIKEECFCELILDDKTEWINIPNELKNKIEQTIH